MNREDFLARVRQAAHAGRLHRVHTREVPAEVGYVGAGDDPPARLAAEIDAAGGKAWLVDDLAAGRRCLSQLIDAKRPRSVLCWQHSLLETLGVRELLSSAGAQAVSHEQLSSLPPEERRTAMLAADLGIASADWAVAETGSLAVCAGPGQERIVTLLPPVLISIVDASRIVPDLFDLFDRLAEPQAGAVRGGENGGHRPAYELPSNLVLITGPSKTGDIELQLTTGVHGPGEWHVIVIREDLSDRKA